MNGSKVVIITESTKFNNELEECFRAQGYKNVLSYSEPIAALKALSRGKSADIVIMDVIMSTCDGIQLMQNLKKHDNCLNTAFVGMLPYSSDSAINIALKNGMDYVMAMPTSVQDIVSRAKLVISTKRSGKSCTESISEALLNDIRQSETLDCDDFIRHTLIDIGVSPRLEGYNYIFSGIKLYVKCPFNKRLRITQDIYPEIAKEHSTTPQAVERSMRYAINTAWLTGDIDMQVKLFGYSIDSERGYPTNKECLTAIAEHAKMWLKAKKRREERKREEENRKRGKDEDRDEE